MEPSSIKYHKSTKYDNPNENRIFAKSFYKWNPLFHGTLIIMACTDSQESVSIVDERHTVGFSSRYHHQVPYLSITLQREILQANRCSR